MLGGVQMLYRFGAMARHVKVIGSAGAIHLTDGLDYVIVDGIQIVPVADV